ncbi:adrenocorticotropic hormone receptor-like [Antedon mediterranea]|uniref:adrenocorticotropic hormone receptor-like n=1 Tax=Antedon mediterranea TaxID=105859 RepID=UPI003AF6AC38
MIVNNTFRRFKIQYIKAHTKGSLSDMMESNETGSFLCNYSLSGIYYQILGADEYHVNKVLFQITCVIAVLLNVFVILQFIVEKELRKRSHIFTCSLALSDGLFAVFFLISVKIKNASTTSSIIVATVGISASLVSLFTLLAIAVERLLVIVLFPFNPNVNSARKIFFILALIWLFSFIFIGLLFAFGHLYEMETFLTIFKICLIHILHSIYFMIYRYVAKQDKKMEAHRFRGSLQSNTNVSTTRKLLKTFSIIISSYALCWLPINVTTLLDIFLNISCTSEIYIDVYAIAFNFAALYAVINPLVYGWRNKDIRKSVKKRLFICDKQNPSKEKVTNGQVQKRKNTAQKTATVGLKVITK